MAATASTATRSRARSPGRESGATDPDPLTLTECARPWTAFFAARVSRMKRPRTGRAPGHGWLLVCAAPRLQHLVWASTPRRLSHSSDPKRGCCDVDAGFDLALFDPRFSGKLTRKDSRAGASARCVSGSPRNAGARARRESSCIGRPSPAGSGSRDLLRVKLARALGHRLARRDRRGAHGGSRTKPPDARVVATSAARAEPPRRSRGRYPLPYAQYVSPPTRPRRVASSVASARVETRSLR